MNPISTLRLTAVLLAVFAIAGCDNDDEGAPSLKLGKPCAIQFRRDALGAAAPLPIAPMTVNINGADTNITGTVMRTTAGWIVLEKEGGEIWIPKGVILLIQQGS